MKSIEFTVEISGNRISPKIELQNKLLSVEREMGISFFDIREVAGDNFHSPHSSSQSRSFFGMHHRHFDSFDEPEMKQKFIVTLYLEDFATSQQVRAGLARLEANFANMQITDDDDLRELDQDNEVEETLPTQTTVHQFTKLPLFNLDPISAVKHQTEIQFKLSCNLPKQSARNKDEPMSRDEKKFLFIVQEIQQRFPMLITNFNVNLQRNVWSCIVGIEITINAITVSKLVDSIDDSNRLKKCIEECIAEHQKGQDQFSLSSLELMLTEKPFRTVAIELGPHVRSILFNHDRGFNIVNMACELTQITDANTADHSFSLNQTSTLPNTIAYQRNAHFITGVTYENTAPQLTLRPVAETPTPSFFPAPKNDTRKAEYLAHLKNRYNVTELTPKNLEKAFRNAAGNNYSADLIWMFHFKEQFPFNPNGVSETGSKKTAMHHCVAKKYVECVKVLMQHGVDLDLEDENQLTARQLIAESELEEIKTLVAVAPRQ